MSAGNHNIYIEQGASWTYNIVVNQTDNIPVDLTGYTGKCQIRPQAGSSTLYAEVKVEFLDQINGKITLSLTDEQTSAIPSTGQDNTDFNNYVYDLTITDSLGMTIRLLNGNVLLSPGVTKEQ